MPIQFSKFIHTKTGKIVMSILLGLGLATLFRMSCNGKDCISYYAPPFEKINDKIYKFNDECVKFNYSSTKCDEKREVIGFE